MATQTFYPKVSPDVPWNVRQHLQLIYQKLNNHALAISTTSSAVNTNTVQEIIQQIPTGGGGGGGGGGGSTLAGLGGVNNQTGQTTYTTQNTDAGILIVLSDASPIAVTLNTGVSTPWMAFFANLGTGTATLTPVSGTISYADNPGAASMPLGGGLSAMVVFDGSNWWAAIVPIQPESITAIAHEFLTSYDSATGLFTQAQPAFTDIAGVATPAQLPVATVSALGAVKPDGTTITITAGVLSAAAAGGGLFAGFISTPPTQASAGLTSAMNHAGTLTVTDSAAGISLVDSASEGSNLFLEGQMGTYPTAPFSRSALFSVPMVMTNYVAVGMVIADTLTGNMMYCALVYSNGWQMQINTATSPTTYDAAVSFGNVAPGSFLWLRLDDDGTNVTFSISTDNIAYTPVFTPIDKATSFLGASGFNFLGFAISPQGSALGSSLMAWL